MQYRAATSFFFSLYLSFFSLTMQYRVATSFFFSLYLSFFSLTFYLLYFSDGSADTIIIIFFLIQVNGTSRLALVLSSSLPMRVIVN